MKKKKLKLSLNKEVISNLQAKSIVGGLTQGCDPNSDNGCYTNGDDTMTCPWYSCAC